MSLVSLVSLVVGLVLIFLLLWAGETLIDNAKGKQILYVVVVVFAVIWVLQCFGLMGPIGDLRIK